MMLNLMAVLYIFRFLLKRRRTTTKNTGTKKIAGIVAVTIRPLRLYRRRSAHRSRRRS